MALMVGPNGRFRIGIHVVGERFTVERLTQVERSEACPDGQIAYFNVHDRSDHSSMTIDGEDAERLETLWQGVVAKQLPHEDIEKHLVRVFDIECPPE